MAYSCFPLLPTCPLPPPNLQVFPEDNMQESWARKQCPAHKNLHSLSNAHAHSTPSSTQVETEAVKNQLQAQPRARSSFNMQLDRGGGSYGRKRSISPSPMEISRL